jgi:hypothetical protein
MFPFIRDAVLKGDWKGVERQVRMTAGVLTRAGERLVR